MTDKDTTEHVRDPTEGSDMLKESADRAREELDDFLGSQETVSGKFDDKLGSSRSNIDYSDRVQHIGKAHSYTSTGAFNIQNKILVILGTILSIVLLVPITSYIMIYDIKQIVEGFESLYNDYTFTIILLVGLISAIMLGLTEFLFLGGFNKRNQKTRKLERTILFVLLFIQFASHTYFAYLVVGSKNETKKAVVMNSTSTTEGIQTKGLEDSSRDITEQIKALLEEKKSLNKTIEMENKNIEEFSKQIVRLTKLRNPTRKQVRARQALYTNKQKSKEAIDRANQRQKEISQELKQLRDEKLSLTDKLTKVSSSLDAELEESGFWRIIYTIILLFLFEGLSHIHWLAFYRVIKNAPPDLVEDYREMSYILDWGKMFQNKAQEATMVVAGQQIRLADDSINNLKLYGKSMSYATQSNTAAMIETTKSNVAALGTSVNAMRENTKGIVLLAQTIKRDGLGANLGYQERTDGKKVELSETTFAPAPASLVEALDFLVEEFQPLTKPTIKIAVGENGGYCDPLTDIIVIGEKEPEKLTVLAHEFCHHLGYVKHDTEFRELEESIIKGLEVWLKTTQHKPS